MDKKVGIILVNYKDYAAKFLRDCRDSLRLQSYAPENTSIYIVDNASTPESLKYLQVNYPEAVVLPRVDGNYAAANNLGFKQAISDGCEYLVTVNMDTEMATDWLLELVEALNSNPEAGIAQSKILLYPLSAEEREKPRINSLGNIIHFLGFGFTSNYGEPDREITGYPKIGGYASGCSFIIRRAVFEKIGGYNEEFYMYHDDIELSLKTKLAGHDIILAPRSVIFHKYEFSRSLNMLYYMERNRYLLLLSFYPIGLLILVGLPGILMDIGMLFYSFVKGWFVTEMKIYIYFAHYRNYVKIQKTRQALKKIKIIPFSKLARDFSGIIEFKEIANPLLSYIVNPLFNLYWSLVKKIV
ncbi:MAG: glycosyltransferase family 2 protein [Patescibacteria group bacterium]|jgi:GT2 family glycosyltransferase